ncbi:DUF4340 domain-containing protein [Zavarzinia compransoris]|uniref:DUF4340 domain-containing protein n=1 Tax=Zavarzinia marina TaxID=2911065 RepID=UPI001F3AD1EE|nr:DUF4340 domain-containing protein [Zavarzinia marina]MCF4165780.1 DUF4340 domain-containing protein [Zavarzinia marina]
MRRSTLVFLLGLTIVLGLTGAWLVAERIRVTSADLSGRPLMPDLKGALNDVATVAIEGAEGRFTLKRVDGERWVMPERGDYPADFGKIRRLLVGLSDMVAIEPKTARPDRYHFLDVEDVGPGTKGLRVTAADSSGTAIADIILGRPVDTLGASRLPRYFVRLAGQDASWEAEADIRPERGAAAWLDRELLVVAPERFATVAVTRNGETATIARETPTGDFAVEGQDADAILPKKGRIGALAVAATYLALEDVQKVKGAPDGKPLATVEYKTFDGLTLTLNLVSIDGQGWTTIEASAGRPEVAPVDVKGPDGEPLLKDAETVRAEAGAINARTKGWLYRLDGTRVIDLTPAPGDLFDPKPAPVPEATPDTP